MSKKDKVAEDTTFPEKWAKVIKELPEFKDIADAASPDELKKIIVICEGNLYIIDREKGADEELVKAKAVAKEASAPYRDASKVQTAKIKYALYLLEGKGIEVGTKDE